VGKAEEFGFFPTRTFATKRNKKRDRPLESGWVTHMDRATYVGKELTRAEMALRVGPEFTRDGA